MIRALMLLAIIQMVNNCWCAESPSSQGGEDVDQFDRNKCVNILLEIVALPHGGNIKQKALDEMIDNKMIALHPRELGAVARMSWALVYPGTSDVEDGPANRLMWRAIRKLADIRGEKSAEELLLLKPLLPDGGDTETLSGAIIWQRNLSEKATPPPAPK